MIFVAGTVKDTLENVQRYVERNLAAGADHLFVFLDAPDAEVEAWLAAHPHATPIVCDETWWVPSRPERLNARQVTNANTAQTALACLPGEHWLFHLDADEVLEIDRERLERDVDAEVVKLAPMEAISTLHGREVPHFKRRLNRGEIALLVERGLLEAPDPDEPINSTWFRGHLMGKVGVRPNPDVWMQLHRVVYCGPDEQELPDFRGDWLAHRHYESVSGREFVRKWLSHLAAGEIRLRPTRRRLAASLAAIVESDLDQAGREEAMLRVYRDQVEDPYDELLAVGVLVELADPSYSPRPVPDLAPVLAALHRADKRAFNPRIAEVWPRPVLEQLNEPLLQPAIDRALASEQSRGVVAPSLARGSWKSALQRVVRRSRG